MPGKDTKTRYQGVFARHRKQCALGRGGGCNCKPSYYGVAYDRARKRHVKTKRMTTAEAARNARADLAKTIERGEAPVSNAIRLRDARERFVTAAREGKTLNKHGRRYKPSAINNVAESLRLHVEPVLGHKRLSDIRRGDLQAIVDELTPKLSGSRVRAVVNAVRSLYRWAQDRDLAGHDPAALVRLPAMDARSSALRRLPNSRTCWPPCRWRKHCHTRSPVMGWVGVPRSFGFAGRRLI